MRYRCNHLCLQKSFKLHRQPAQCCSCSIAGDLSLSITPQFFFSLVIFYIIINFWQKLEASSDVSICPADKIWNHINRVLKEQSVKSDGWPEVASFSAEARSCSALHWNLCSYTGWTRGKSEVSLLLQTLQDPE